MSKVELKQLVSEVKAISQAAREIQQQGISRRALLILIQHSCGTDSTSRTPRKVPIRLIEAVVDGLENLEHFVTEDPE